MVIAALLFFSNLACSKTKDNIARQKNFQPNPIIFNSIRNKRMYKYRLVYMYAMQNRENLKAYHLGLMFFNRSHKIPTMKYLTNSIRSHQFFIGIFTRDLSHEECFSLKTKIDLPFFIFETYQSGKSDFYMLYSRGIRHFTVNASHERSDYMASLNNGAGKDYPNLESFIQCTIKG